MDPNRNFRNREMRFARRTTSISPKLVAIVVSIGSFIAIWRLATPGTAFWVIAISLTLLVWVSSYGIRSALKDVIRFLRRFEDF